jgi:hypothetical protein
MDDYRDTYDADAPKAWAILFIIVMVGASLLGITLDFLQGLLEAIP